MKILGDKIKAFALRKEGKSYGEISQLLKVNKSTISYWFKNIDWSQKIKTQLIEKAKETSRKRLAHLNSLKKIKWTNYYLKAEKEAIKEFKYLKKDKLFITAISLYWGEGDKVFKNGIVRISNIDSKILQIFNDFLQKICRVKVEKIGVSVLLYPDLSSAKCLKFWSEGIRISEDRFYKPTVVKGRHKTKRLGNGVCVVSVHDKYLKKKMLVWLELFGKEF